MQSHHWINPAKSSSRSLAKPSPTVTVTGPHTGSESPSVPCHASAFPSQLWGWGPFMPPRSQGEGTRSSRLTASQPRYGARLCRLRQLVGWETQFLLGSSLPFGTLVWRNDLERFRAEAPWCLPSRRASMLHCSAPGLFHATSSGPRGSQHSGEGVLGWGHGPGMARQEGAHPSSQLRCPRKFLSASAQPGGSRDPRAAAGWAAG